MSHQSRKRLHSPQLIRQRQMSSRRAQIPNKLLRIYQELLQMNSSVGVTVLCPGFVNTRIIDSERNRPEHMQQPLTEADQQRDQIRAVVTDLYSRTKPPAEVAELVADAIVAKRLYCYTDDAFDESIAAHHGYMRSADNPPSVGTLFDHLAH